MQSLKINGQRWNLDANPDLLYELLLSITNIEERLHSIDKRLLKVENNHSQKDPSKNYFVPRKNQPR